ncbi:MAG: hypothetical protein L6R35_004059 [Caloplaca aegaea]|nr:MAG: hypothetical protein L6R35_004059 [Caloplaca aegaea]
MTQSEGQKIANPMEPTQSLKSPSRVPNAEKEVHPQKEIFEEDSTLTKAEKIERHGGPDDDIRESSPKRIRIENLATKDTSMTETTSSERRKGVAPIKAEYLIYPTGTNRDRDAAIHDDDAAEGAAHEPSQKDDASRGKRKQKSKGQNIGRNFGSSKDEVSLCASRMSKPEFSPATCPYGEGCKFEHDLRKYLREWKRADLTTFGGICPIWKNRGRCSVGWKCRFVGSHMEERATDDGRKELVLTEKPGMEGSLPVDDGTKSIGTLNEISTQAKSDLMKRKFTTPKADQYSKWLDTLAQKPEEQRDHRPKKPPSKAVETDNRISNEDAHQQAKEDNRAQYISPPFLPSEKRRIYFGPETPILAPLTTQGNLPFRRLCVSLGAQLTYSEMAMSMPLIQGQRSEWALMRAHESETTPPAYNPPTKTTVTDYDNSRDLKFGAQISANKPWQAIKVAETLTRLCPHLRLIDINCGCPIDLVYRTGAGSALLDAQGKLDKMVRGMNAVSGSVPITVKIRMGTKDGKPTALKLIERLVYGGPDADNLGGGGGGSGVAAITLHGRSRQQRYTKSADWSYIADCATLIKRFHEKGDELTDTIRAPDERTQPAAAGGSRGGEEKVYFIGNGDCYSHTTYHEHLSTSGVSAIMLARGALIKPWLFEEIATGQYLDKTATERLAYIARFVHHGLECWGSDEVGVGTTRRFLLEYLSFAHRYVPVGILERLPPHIQDRPPAWRGRNDLETLLASGDYRDWIRISEMFLGKAHPGFRFEPKHRSNNSYGIDAEG